ncbi:hypothetical protein [Novosphingobium sp. P6W]|uniref:hypothetical protein n=1 Tax=Novosphingobium sp. P6W TaxID=1609758 RepID=UPI0006976780|nr:hypothetical protein [Novosphingobium sp. P6W]AXB80332.1 hypothetical protein TQ38_027555 [Novosphingobium sp. P6W]
MVYEELKVLMNHTDDLTYEKVIDMLLADLRAHGRDLSDPSDPLTDYAFIRLLTRLYDSGGQWVFSPEPDIARST